MATRSPMAAKTAKARKMDIAERLYVQSRGDAADIQRGRTLMFYDTYGCTRNPKVQSEWAISHSLNPTEQWVIRKGYAKDPLAERCYAEKHDTIYAAVYYDNGRRVIMPLEEARKAYFTDEHVVRYFSRVESKDSGVVV